MLRSDFYKALDVKDMQLSRIWGLKYIRKRFKIPYEKLYNNNAKYKAKNKDQKILNYKYRRI